MRVIPSSETRRYGGPSNANAGRKPRLTRLEQAHRMARLAIIEKSKARYLHLVCGHYQTLEDDERVSHWRPKKGVTWCDNCDLWVEIAKPPAPVDNGDTPMF